MTNLKSGSFERIRRSGRLPLVILLMIFVNIFASGSDPIGRKEVVNMLKTLDRELDQRDVYISRRRATIDSLKTALDAQSQSAESKLSTLLMLGDTYNAYNTDSAVSIYSRGVILAKDLNLDSIAVRFEMRRLTYLPLLAFISQAEDELSKIDYESLPKGLRGEYFDAARQMYSYIASYYVNYPEVYDRYMAKSHEAQGALINHLEEGSPRYMLNKGEYFYYNKEYSKTKALIMLLIDQLPPENNLYARACHLLAEISKARGEHYAYEYYLALSAIADTRGATLEVASLQELGKTIYLSGDIEHAYDYLSVALSEAVECNAPLRILQSSQVLPIIESAHKAEIRGSKIRNYIVMAIMAILLIILGATLYVLHRKNRQMNRMALRLEDANSTKDVYISQFLNLCSIYMDKLTQFNKMVNRKITTGKVDDLLKITKQGKYIEEHSKEFYDVFDDAFLHIYPNFVNEVNHLLRPEEQIILREGEKLNTDLRIIAFMRLGIEESSRIAQMLNYSVYTIYTYRNKLKNRAVSRDTFETDIMNIKSVS